MPMSPERNRRVAGSTPLTMTFSGGMQELHEYIKEDHDTHYDFRYVFKFRNRKDHFEKLWNMKISARESLDDWLLVSDVPPHLAEICANACSEMIENCIKYSGDDSMTVVAIHVTNTTIMIETVNTTNPEHAAELRKSLDMLEAADDPKQVFVQKLLNPVQGKSRLGLIKIVMETKGTLRVIPHAEDDIAHVKLCMNAG